MARRWPSPCFHYKYKGHSPLIWKYDRPQPLNKPVTVEVLCWAFLSLSLSPSSCNSRLSLRWKLRQKWFSASARNRILPRAAFEERREVSPVGPGSGQWVSAEQFAEVFCPASHKTSPPQERFTTHQFGWNLATKKCPAATFFVILYFLFLSFFKRLYSWLLVTTSDNGPDASVPLLLVCVFLQLFFAALLLETFAISIKWITG